MGTENAADRARLGETNAITRYQTDLESAGERAAAGEQGALDRRNLIDINLDTQSRFLNTPYDISRANYDVSQLPRSALYDPLTAAQGPLNFFRMGEGRAPTAVGRPDAVVAPSATYAVGNALSNVGGTVLQDQAAGGQGWNTIFNKKKKTTEQPLREFSVSG